MNIKSSVSDFSNLKYLNPMLPCKYRELDLLAKDSEYIYIHTYIYIYIYIYKSKHAYLISERYLPASAELSHPCKKLPIAAAMATSTTSLIFIY